jgi:4-hydroxybenzoate polyprenyltransferase
MREKFKNYFKLMRFHKPIGIFLLLWPTLWALWLAGNGEPNMFIVFIFVLGVIIMRAAGCIINDIADKKFDLHVKRTQDRPLTSGKITILEAWALFVFLMMLALMLVLLLNPLTIALAFIGALLAMIYPLLKRITHLPQLGLGIAFAWSVPMAFAAQLDEIPSKSWLIFLAAALWPVIYDTMYAMVDREDDLNIGVKSTAILFGKYDRHIIGLLQFIWWVLLIAIGSVFQLNYFYYISVIAAGFLMIYQQKCIYRREPESCFKAFLNNHWIGLIIFAGIIAS